MIATLPHKKGGPSATKAAFSGGSFQVVFSRRLGPLSEAAEQMLNRTIQTWLLCGSLGLRCTRGGGAFQLKGTPQTAKEYLRFAERLFNKADLRIAVLPTPYTSAEGARHDITDTLSHQAMNRLNYPLGAVRQGGNDPAPRRKTSPLKLTIRKFDSGFHIIAVWDGRQVVTGNSIRDLEGAVGQLQHARKSIGEQLAVVLGRLTA
jgi:hypothetical protein